MADNRRHNEDPHPPESTGERRACSDKECREARDMWLTEVLLPKLMIRFWVGIFAVVSALSGMFLYLSKNEIRDFELKIQGQYEHTSTHREDIGRVEGKIDSLNADLKHSINEVLMRLDRNYSEISMVKKK